jgi:hypothetical protein
MGGKGEPVLMCVFIGQWHPRPFGENVGVSGYA